MNLGRSEVDVVTVLRRCHKDDGDKLLGAITNLRGYRCAEQGPYLAHVDSVLLQTGTLVQQLEGAVDEIEVAQAELDAILDGTAIKAEEHVRAALAALDRALRRSGGQYDDGYKKARGAIPHDPDDPAEAQIRRGR